MAIQLRKKAARKKPSKTNSGEKLTIRVDKIERDIKDGTGSEIKNEGYVYFKIYLDVNDTKIETKKRIRLDRPDRMTNKFLEKLKPLAEREYREKRYFVANEAAPEIFLSYLENYEDVMDGMMLLFEEVEGFIKTGKINKLKTTEIDF